MADYNLNLWNIAVYGGSQDNTEILTQWDDIQASRIGPHRLIAHLKKSNLKAYVSGRYENERYGTVDVWVTVVKADWWTTFTAIVASEKQPPCSNRGVTTND